RSPPHGPTTHQPLRGISGAAGRPGDPECFVPAVLPPGGDGGGVPGRTELRRGEAAAAGGPPGGQLLPGVPGELPAGHHLLDHLSVSDCVSVPGSLLSDPERRERPVSAPAGAGPSVADLHLCLFLPPSGPVRQQAPAARPQRLPPEPDPPGPHHLPDGPDPGPPAHLDGVRPASALHLGVLAAGGVLRGGLLLGPAPAEGLCRPDARGTGGLTPFTAAPAGARHIPLHIRRHSTCPNLLLSSWPPGWRAATTR